MNAITEAAGPAVSAVIQSRIMDLDRKSENLPEMEHFEHVLFRLMEAGIPEAKYEMTHRFSPGVYIREILMGAGSVLIGHEHTGKHWNIVLSGFATVHSEGETKTVQAGEVFESSEGVRKALEIHMDMRWMTIHPNPNNWGIEDLDKMEEEIRVKSETHESHREILKQISDFNRKGLE